MSEPRFEWDPAKAAANERKHGVSFAVVVHCYRAPDDTIRLISARKATSSERRQYTARWQP